MKHLASKKEVLTAAGLSFMIAGITDEMIDEQFSWNMIINTVYGLQEKLLSEKGTYQLRNGLFDVTNSDVFKGVLS